MDIKISGYFFNVTQLLFKMLVTSKNDPVTFKCDPVTF